MKNNVLLASMIIFTKFIMVEGGGQMSGLFNW